jgi:hypothetical protein
MLICSSAGRSDYSVGRLRIGIFSHKLGRVVLTLWSLSSLFCVSPNRIFTRSDVYQVFMIGVAVRSRLQLVPRIFSRGRGVIPSLAGLGEQSCQRSYQFGM